MMGLRTHEVFLLSVWFQFLIIAAVTNPEDAAILKSLKDIIEDGLPPNWQGSDPCDDQWEGIECSRSRVTTITLSSMGLTGSLSGDITGLSELLTLDLSNNKDLKGSLPSSIENLKKLTNLILVGCSLSGPIPDSIGSLQQLVFLSLNSNSFSGKIPASIGNLSKLLWLDLTDNQLDGTIPVSDGVSPGLDMLVHTKHFHLGKNKLSGHIPKKLFSSDMELIHVLLDRNQLTGPLPSSLGLVKTLEVVRFDRNFLSGTVPSNFNNLTNLNALFLSNNGLTGPIPNLTNLTTLSYLDMSNNTFEPSLIPSWFSTLQSLRTLTMDHTELEGEVPATIFSLNLLQIVDLKHNRLNGTFDIGANHSSQLQSINLQSNSITAFMDRPGANKDITIILAGNPICQSGDPKDYCRATERDSSYSTPPKNCLPTSCSSDQISSPTCMCAYPYTGILSFRPPSNKTCYQNLEQSILQQSQYSKLPVDSVSLSNPRKSQSQYLEISLAVFPSGQDSFNRTGISMIGFFLSNPTYVPPEEFRPLFFNGDPYLHFTRETRKSEKSTSIGVIIGAAVGGCVLLLLLTAFFGRDQKRIFHPYQGHLIVERMNLSVLRILLPHYPGISYPAVSRRTGTPQDPAVSRSTPQDPTVSRRTPQDPAVSRRTSPQDPAVPRRTQPAGSHRTPQDPVGPRRTSPQYPAGPSLQDPTGSRSTPQDPACRIPQYPAGPRRTSPQDSAVPSRTQPAGSHRTPQYPAGSHSIPQDQHAGSRRTPPAGSHRTPQYPAGPARRIPQYPEGPSLQDPAGPSRTDTPQYPAGPRRIPQYPAGPSLQDPAVPHTRTGPPSTSQPPNIEGVNKGGRNTPSVRLPRKNKSSCNEGQ